MKSKYVFSKLKDIDLMNLVSIYIPYLLAIGVVILFTIIEGGFVAFLTGMVFLFSSALRISIILLKKREKNQSSSIISDWKELRQQLTLILSKNKILLDTAVELRSDEKSTVILSEEHVNGNFFEENEDLIKTIRKIGIDGILCLIFLLQQEPAIASVRAIQRSLKIPIASVYRHLQKITDSSLVTTYYEPQKPNKILYRITDEGSSIIIKLYELLGGSMVPTFDISTENQGISTEVR